MQSRNAPCACGSGKKYKVCCLAIDEAARRQVKEPCVIILMPSRGQICYETYLALANNMDDVKHVLCTIGRRPIVQARNELAAEALRFAKEHAEHEWFALWLDDDAWFTPGTVRTMVNAMRDVPSIDALFGNFCGRGPFANPVAYRKARDGNSFPREGVDCQHGDLIEIDEAGFHFVLMRTSLLERLGPNPFDIPADALPTDTEDFAFCRRAKKAGARLVVGMGLPIVHVDPRDGSAYFPGMPTAQMVENSVRRVDLTHTTTTGATKTLEQREYGLPAFERFLAEHS